MMRSVVRLLGAIALISLATSALLIGAAAWFGTPLDHAVIQIEDANFTFADLTAAHWLLAFAGVALALLVVLLVVPLALLVPLALAVVGAACGLAVALAVTAIVCSPLVLIGWLLWRALRPAPSSSSPSPATATMA